MICNAESQHNRYLGICCVAGVQRRISAVLFPPWAGDKETLSRGGGKAGLELQVFEIVEGRTPPPATAEPWPEY